MTDVPLPPIRIGYAWSCELDFPSGFFSAGESVRTKLRRYIGDTLAVAPTDTIVGDSVTWTLSEAQTANMLPGTYRAEAEIYTIASPGNKGSFITDTRYVIPCNHSPSE